MLTHEGRKGKDLLANPSLFLILTVSLSLSLFSSLLFLRFSGARALVAKLPRKTRWAAIETSILSINI